MIFLWINTLKYLLIVYCYPGFFYIVITILWPILLYLLLLPQTCHLFKPHLRMFPMTPSIYKCFPWHLHQSSPLVLMSPNTNFMYVTPPAYRSHPVILLGEYCWHMTVQQSHSSTWTRVLLSICQTHGRLPREWN